MQLSGRLDGRVKFDAKRVTNEWILAIPAAAGGVDPTKMEGGEVKRRLVQEQMYRLQEEERQQIDHQDLILLDTPRFRWNHGYKKAANGA